MVFGIFGKKGRKAAAEINKFTNRDLMEAIVGGALLVAHADGELEESELVNLEAQIKANPALANFGPEIGQTINKFIAMFDAGLRMGKMKVMREIRDIQHTPEEAEEVIVTMITIAEADGEIEPEELKVLKEVADVLGVNLKDFDLG